MSRWSVLLGALVSLDGVWRSTGAVVLLRPSEGDGAAEWVHEASVAIAKVVAGKRGRRPGRRREPEPHGVLVAIAESLDPEIAALMSKVLGSLLPAIAGEVWRRRAAGPKLTNTDGHRLRLITARVAVNDPAAVARPGWWRTRTSGPRMPGELSWWGRELTEIERESALAQMRALADRASRSRSPTSRSAGCAGVWSRTRTASRCRSTPRSGCRRWSSCFARLGAEPELARRSVIDPAQDMPPIRLGMPMPFGASQDGGRRLAVTVARRAGTGTRRRDPAQRVAPRAEPARGSRRCCASSSTMPTCWRGGQARSRSGATARRARDGPVVRATGDARRSDLNSDKRPR